MSAALIIKNVHQSFRSGFWLKSIEVLHGISFEVPSGKIFGILGPNGAGKTTLIQLMAGLREPTSGEILVNGSLNVCLRETRRSIGYLPERPYFHEHLTGEQFLNFMGTLSGVDASEINRRIPDVLKTVGLHDVRKIELRRFSKGMLQRIGIAQALMPHPKILLFDEPMSGLDPVGRKEIRSLMTVLMKQGCTVIFSTHIIEDVEAICQNVAMIHKGNLVSCGTVEEFLSQGQQQVESYFKHEVW